MSWAAYYNEEYDRRPLWQKAVNEVVFWVIVLIGIVTFPIWFTWIMYEGWRKR